MVAGKHSQAGATTHTRKKGRLVMRTPEIRISQALIPNGEMYYQHKRVDPLTELYVRTSTLNTAREMRMGSELISGWTESECMQVTCADVPGKKTIDAIPSNINTERRSSKCNCYLWLRPHLIPMAVFSMENHTYFVRYECSTPWIAGGTWENCGVDRLSVEASATRAKEWSHTYHQIPVVIHRHLQRDKDQSKVGKHTLRVDWPRHKIRLNCLKENHSLQDWSLLQANTWPATQNNKHCIQTAGIKAWKKGFTYIMNHNNY